MPRIKNPLGRYKEERTIRWQIVKLGIEKGKIFFTTRNRWSGLNETSHKSGLFNTPKEALLVAKEFCR